MIPLPLDTLKSPAIAPPKSLWRPFMLSVTEASFARRGFTTAHPERRQHLENIGETFIAGYNAGLLAQDILSVCAAIASTPSHFRGFCAEGSAMGVCVRDALSLRRPLLPALLARFNDDYTYLAHVGCGWAMARLPWRRSKIMKSLDTLLVPLAFDGWGFHDCYFDPGKVRRGSGRSVVRAGGAAARRSWDQGAGRALWFACGGDIGVACRLVMDIPETRRPDLFAGLGLAITYAGGAGLDELEKARAHAGLYQGDLAQGSAFALEAHVHGATASPAVFERAATLTGVAGEKICEIVRAAMPLPLGNCDGISARSWTLYESWRSRVAGHLAQAKGGVS
jgi:hypothetical protein